MILGSLIRPSDETVLGWGAVEQSRHLPLLRELARDDNDSDVRRTEIQGIINSDDRESIQAWLEDANFDLPVDVLAILDEHLYAPPRSKQL